MCRFVGTAPAIFGLVLSGVGADVGPKFTIPGQILKHFLGHLAQPKGGFITSAVAMSIVPCECLGCQLRSLAQRPSPGDPAVAIAATWVGYKWGL